MSTLLSIWDTTRLRLLVEMESHGSLSGAARAIGIGQPGASEHLRVLEAASGLRLAERTGHGSTLTEAGRILARQASRALASLEAGEEELAALSGLQTGDVRIGASPVPGAYVLPDVLRAFTAAFPSIRVSLEIAPTREILDGVISGRVRIAVVCADAELPRVMLEPFSRDEIVGIARPGLLDVRDGVVDPAVLSGLTLLEREDGSSSREATERELSRIGVRWQSVWRVGSSEAIKRATRAGLGVGFVSEWTLADELARGELVAFRLAGTPPFLGSLSIARLASASPSPAEQHFASQLRLHGDGRERGARVPA